MSSLAAVDQYILKAQPFAQPILNHLRALVHHACPEVEERIKWSFPHFDYKGAPMCSMAGFKQHCAFGFWKASLMKDTSLFLEATGESSMGHLGKIKSLEDLPPDRKIISWIREAAKMNDEGIKIIKQIIPKSAIPIPADFNASLLANKKAHLNFQTFTAAGQREYLEWITEAKTAPTKEKRMTQALEWIAEGKKRNWKYEK